MQGQYLDSTMKAFIKSHSVGALCENGTSLESYSLCFVPALVAMYASQPDLLKHMESVVSLFQVSRNQY